MGVDVSGDDWLRGGYGERGKAKWPYRTTAHIKGLLLGGTTACLTAASGNGVSAVRLPGARGLEVVHGGAGLSSTAALSSGDRGYQSSRLWRQRCAQRTSRERSAARAAA